MNEPAYRPLHSKMVAAIVLAACTPLFVVSGLILHNDNRSYREKIHAHLGELVQKHRQRIDVTTAASGSNILVEISDSGPGIPEADLGRIFDPFFTTKPPGKGTGLGLSICRGIIDKMGGRIKVSGRAGGGATFCVCIPTAREGRHTDVRQY